VHIHHVTPILNVSDLAASIAWFEQLGWERGLTWTATGGSKVPQTPTSAAPPTSARSAPGTRRSSCFATGRVLREAPWGVREFHLRHPEGHTFRVSAPLG